MNKWYSMKKRLHPYRGCSQPIYDASHNEEKSPMFALVDLMTYTT